MIVVEGNNYKQCNFENISSCRRNYKENFSCYTQLALRSELTLQLCVVACHWWYTSNANLNKAVTRGPTQDPVAQMLLDQSVM